MLKYPDIVIAFFQKKKPTKITKAISKIRVVEVTSFDIYLFANLFICKSIYLKIYLFEIIKV